MSTFPKHEAALRSALADVGVHESPMGSNRGLRVQTYQRATWLPGTGWPWCVAAWLYWTLGAGLQMPYKGAGSYALHDWAVKNGWRVPVHEAQPGDACVFNIGAGHVGMVIEVTSTSVKTVDGNVSDSVGLRERPFSLVRGCVHVPEAPVHLPPAKPGAFEVVTSISGHSRVIFNGKASTIGEKLPRFLQKYPSITVRRRKR